ncbi:FitA-like ribbon-helix-helix domain-containing protein [Parasphingorhabdus sp.]|uniref:FitA-like ribbon-helix-helix domain-containing protein n=1 Tax=Parasphingorhabdus sp. TaxID=2709688 RepID=UPI003A8DB7BC
MGSVTVRKIDDATKQSLREVAAKQGRSIEAELRALIERTYGPKKTGSSDDLPDKKVGENRAEYLIRIAPDCDPLDIPSRDRGIPDPEFP